MRFYLRQRPGKYSITAQQKKLIQAMDFCGIKKGITKTELMDKMKNCIPQFYKENRGH